jgi:hypothetical protein
MSGSPFGQNREGRSAPRLAPILLALPAHRDLLLVSKAEAQRVGSISGLSHRNGCSREGPSKNIYLDHCFRSKCLGVVRAWRKYQCAHWLLTILTIGIVLTSGLAQAQTYDPTYPVCLYVDAYGTSPQYRCSFSTMDQCRASATGGCAASTRITLVRPRR